MAPERGIEIIERPAQFAILRELGIPFGTGLAFSRPLRARDFPAYTQGESDY